MAGKSIRPIMRRLIEAQKKPEERIFDTLSEISDNLKIIAIAETIRAKQGKPSIFVRPWPKKGDNE